MVFGPGSSAALRNRRPGGGSTIRSAHRGEAYRDIVVRMLAALHDAREAASGHEALIVSHQLPITGLGPISRGGGSRTTHGAASAASPA